MALRAAKFSDDAVQAITAEVANLATRPAQYERLLGGAPPENLTIAAPHPVYSLGLDALVEGSGLERAEQVGQRCLIMNDENAVATAEIVDEAGGSGVTTTRGPFTHSTVTTIDEVEGWQKVEEGDYEMRLLRIPALYLMSLWAHSADGETDLFSPLEPAPQGLDPKQSYSWEELAEVLRPLAKKQLDGPANAGPAVA
ncbi:MAG TPA: hypothetical protein VFY48_04910 [Solirubrobacterales bacterium]|nr:hypothetical protein [Solirubrobacterales bacterium]